jgi:hypothetical protein
MFIDLARAYNDPDIRPPNRYSGQPEFPYGEFRESTEMA